VIRIPQALIDEIVEHAREDLPNEACGMITAIDGAPVAAYRLSNAERNPYRYVIDPAQQLIIEQHIQASNQTLFAIYHSHVASEARPSGTDRNMAVLPPGDFKHGQLIYPTAYYILVSLADATPVVRAFRIGRRGGVREIRIQVVADRPDFPAPTPVAFGPPRHTRFAWGARTYLMGVINASPDSFSGDGIADPKAAAAIARRMVSEGVDLIDIGAASTRPGHAPVPPEEEWERLAPVLSAVRSAVAVPITVDTSKASVARRALAAGADAINDTNGLRADPALVEAIGGGREKNAPRTRPTPAVLMHNQRGRPFSGDVIADVRAGLRASLKLARDAGVDERRLILDPGFGFGWEPAQNLELLRRLGELRDLGRPLLIGTSRKSTIGLVLERAEAERAWGTAATVALAIAAGADIVRVHDVREMAEVARMTDAVVRRWPPAERRVWLGLGGNVGDRLAVFRRALAGLEAGGVAVQLVSAVYETPPWGIVDQPCFANAALQARTALAPHDLLALAKRLEAAAGRDFAAPRNSARPLDIDLLHVEGVQLEEPVLTLPHLHLHERAFVLVPLAEIAPELRHPRLGATMLELRAAVSDAGIEPLGELAWWLPALRPGAGH